MKTKTTTEASKDSFTTGDVVDVLHMAPTTIWRAVLKGQIDAYQTPGGHYRMTRKEFDRVIAKYRPHYEISFQERERQKMSRTIRELRRRIRELEVSRHDAIC